MGGFDELLYLEFLLQFLCSLRNPLTANRFTH